jgi:hypothetical protein
MRKIIVTFLCFSTIIQASENQSLVFLTEESLLKKECEKSRSLLAYVPYTQAKEQARACEILKKLLLQKYNEEEIKSNHKPGFLETVVEGFIPGLKVIGGLAKNEAEKKMIHTILPKAEEETLWKEYDYLQQAKEKAYTAGCLAFKEKKKKEQEEKERKKSSRGPFHKF